MLLLSRNEGAVPIDRDKTSMRSTVVVENVVVVGGSNAFELVDLFQEYWKTGSLLSLDFCTFFFCMNRVQGKE